MIITIKTMYDAGKDLGFGMGNLNNQKLRTIEFLRSSAKHKPPQVASSYY